MMKHFGSKGGWVDVCGGKKGMHREGGCKDEATKYARAHTFEKMD